MGIRPNADEASAIGHARKASTSPKKVHIDTRELQTLQPSLESQPEPSVVEQSQLTKVGKLQKQPLLTIDKACLSCSGNMNQTIKQFKIACLSYN